MKFWAYIRIFSLSLGLALFFPFFSVSAAYYANNPSLCPTEAYSQSCVGGLKVCGVNASNVVSCYNTDSLSAPAAAGNASSGTVTASGGYVVDCYAYDSAAPYCNNNGAFICQQSTACNNLAKVTVCTAGQWVNSTCGDCKAGYHDCDGNSANGCAGSTEHDGVACTTPLGLPGTYSNCVCVGSVLKLGSDSVSGTDVRQGGTAAVLFVNGPLVGIGNSNPTAAFSVSDGNIFIDDSAITSGTPKAAITKEYLDSSLSAFNTESNLWKLNGSNVYASSTSWNVGIGIINPSQKLSIKDNGTVINGQYTFGIHTDDQAVYNAGFYYKV